MSKSVSENCQETKSVCEKMASSPRPAPPEEERGRIFQTRSKECRNSKPKRKAMRRGAGARRRWRARGSFSVSDFGPLWDFGVRISSFVLAILLQLAVLAANAADAPLRI